MVDAPPHEFEALVHEDGHWSARDFCVWLEYSDYERFRRTAVGRAMSACVALGIDLTENFRWSEIRDSDGSVFSDIRLTRFACYLVAMNADPRKPKVAEAQAYLAGLAEAFREYVEAAEEIDRLIVRGELAEEEKSLASTAKAHAVENYAFFVNAGYRGMYNMNVTQLRKFKGIPGPRTPLDFMRSEELAANLFRITQTGAKIRNQGIRGQLPLEGAAQTVGQAVRRMMWELSRTRPEDLPPGDDIKNVRKRLKATHRSFQRLDSKSGSSPG